MGFEGFLNQIFQPYFYYSVIFLVVSFVSVSILTKYCSFIGQRTKSLLYLIPLALPLAVMLVFVPQTSIHTSYEQLKTLSVFTGRMSSGSAGGLPQAPTPFSYIATVSSSVLSVTGILCLAGLIAGAAFGLSMVLADDRVARRILHVILLSPEEHQWLQAEIAESSKKLAVATPKIGLVEDLRPNAFTIGYGENATIVFSVGLFNVLNKEEIVAVASHELAHVKNNDFFFKTISNALTTVSFFNPLSYLASTSAQREREMYADERAISVLQRPSALGDALAKICKAIQSFPKESLLANFSSNLLISSSVLHRAGILATHPRLDTRLKRIAVPKASGKLCSSRNRQVAVLLSLILILSAVAVSLAMADLQVNFTADLAASQNLKLTPSTFSSSLFLPAAYHGGLGGNQSFAPAVMQPQYNATQYMPSVFYRNYSGQNVGNYVPAFNNAFQPQHYETQMFTPASQNQTADYGATIIGLHDPTCLG